MIRKRMIALVICLSVCLCSCGNANVTGGEGVSVPSSEAPSNFENEQSGSGEHTEEKGVYTKITAEEAYEMMQSREVVIVDVRSEAEYQSGFIPKAILLPHDKIGSERPAELPDLSATILVYCRSGRRSEIAAKKLIELGYTDVYDFGGINDWQYDLEYPK